MTIPDDLSAVPQAHRVTVFYCHNPQCRRPHVLLHDEAGRPMAQFVISEIWGPRWIKDVQDALYHGAIDREEGES